MISRLNLLPQGSERVTPFEYWLVSICGWKIWFISVDQGFLRQIRMPFLEMIEQALSAFKGGESWNESSVIPNTDLTLVKNGRYSSPTCQH